MRQPHLLVLCYGDGRELAQLQLLLLTDRWEARPACCMNRKCMLFFLRPWKFLSFDKAVFHLG